MEPSDLELIAALRAGDAAAFEPLVRRYQPRVFATVRRYARREDEVEDIAQEIFIKAFQKIDTFRAKAPFEHWLMRLAVRTCYDCLRRHQRRPEKSFSEFTPEQEEWLETVAARSEAADERAAAAKELIDKILEQLSPAARLVITLLEIEERSIKEISELTGWSAPLVKVRAFRARAEMRKCLHRLALKKYL